MRGLRYQLTAEAPLPIPVTLATKILLPSHSSDTSPAKALPAVIATFASKTQRLWPKLNGAFHEERLAWKQSLELARPGFIVQLEVRISLCCPPLNLLSFTAFSPCSFG